MKRDMDLVREILLKMEEFPFDGRFHDVIVDGHADSEINYHIILLHEAGLIEALDVSNLSCMCWRPQRLTYAGHEFLDAARSDTIWQKAKAWTTNATGTLTVEGLKMGIPHVLKALMQTSVF